MKLIVDSGSTKADWALCKGHKIIARTSTMGLNPYFHSPQKIYEELSKKEFAQVISLHEVSEVFFYGAGCSDEVFCNIIREGLQRVFPNAKCMVEHDLLGAARATCARNPGLSGILGTGSNSCAYDGIQVTDNITALAHVLGDEGSGVHLGKLILQAYYYRELPLDLVDEFEKAYPQGKRAIIHEIYSGDGQNVKIAGFAQFVIAHKSHPTIKKLIHTAFNEFINRHLKKYESWQSAEVNLVGSIADLLKEELLEVFSAQKMKLGKIIRKPIEGLVEFHVGNHPEI